MSNFKIQAEDARSAARTGMLRTAHGDIETPVFMPVGTRAAVKTMMPGELQNLGYSLILGNTYHLNDRPGADLVERQGGLHRFMNWPGAILTDSGGYQVFSLADLRTITDDGVAFQSHNDGKKHFIGPKEAMDIQRKLGSDIAMVFDECPPYPCSREDAAKAVGRTLRWAQTCAEQSRAEEQQVFGIVQGSVFNDLRAHCAKELVSIGFDGYAIGGVSVGEPETLIRKGVEDTVCHLPEDRPRYLMGVGYLPQVLDAVAEGVDMFDCVIPTRLARNGTAFTHRGRYPVKSAVYREDDRPIEEGCACPACAGFSRAYIRHLLNVDEVLGIRLLTLHNLYFYHRVMQDVRDHITAGTFDAYRKDFMDNYRPIADEHLDAT